MRRRWLSPALLLAAGAVLIAGPACAEIKVVTPPGPPPPPYTATPDAPIDKSPAMQAQWAAKVAGMIALRFAVKVDPVKDGILSVYVSKAFYDLEFDLKSNLAFIFYAYAFDGTKTSDMVVFQDARNEKPIATFQRGFGFKLLD